MASNNRGYWSYSWELLTRDEGWHKPLLVLAAARLIPVVGSFGADGYGLEWARLTAWGVDSSPKQKNVDVWGCIKAGARAFVVGLGYGLAFACIRLVLAAILGEILGNLLGIAVTLAAAVLIHVAKLRATIYQSIGAGYQVERICDMVKRDYNGLLRILGIIVSLGLAFGLLSGVVYSLALVPKMGPLVRVLMEYDHYGYVDDWMIASTLLSVFASALPILFVMSYLLGIVKSFIKLIVITSVGLWMRQFDVAHWGDSSDPLPVDVPSDKSEYPSSSDGYASSSAGQQTYSQGYDSTVSQTSDGHRDPATVHTDEPVPTFAIPVPIEDFPRSSDEMMNQTEGSEAAKAWMAEATAASDAPEFIESLLQDLDDDQDVQEALDSLDRAVDASVDEKDAERHAFDDVPMFSLTDVKDEQESAAQAVEGPMVETSAVTDAAKSTADEPAEASAEDCLTREQILARAEAAIQAADMTSATAATSVDAALSDPVAFSLEVFQEAAAESSDDADDWDIVDAVKLTGNTGSKPEEGEQKQGEQKQGE